MSLFVFIIVSSIIFVFHLVFLFKRTCILPISSLYYDDSYVTVGFGIQVNEFKHKLM